MPEQLTVAVPTFRRNDDLRELVPMLLVHTRALRGTHGMRARVLLVDNDPAGGAREVLDPLWGNEVVYVHEPRPGLSAVRQRALDESRGDALVAFLDDDGRPAPGWLEHLVRTWEETGAAAVAGRVLEEYATTPSSWIVAGGFFRRRSLVTGTQVQAAPAGNLMLDLRQVESLGLAFDPRFGLSGGEDTFFTRQLTAAGGRIVWCEESGVVDQVPADRLSRRWVLRRAWSHGNTAALVRQALAGSPRAVLVARGADATGGLARLAAGTGRWLAGLLLRSEVHQAKGLRTAARGFGLVCGSVGHVFEEYAR